MAGKLQWHNYALDSGANVSTRIDRSNGAAQIVTGSVPLFTAPTATTVYGPKEQKGLRKRYINCTSVDQPNLKRKFYVGSAATFALAQVPGSQIRTEAYPGDNAAAGVVEIWNVNSAVGERSGAIPRFTSTGLPQ